MEENNKVTTPTQEEYEALKKENEDLKSKHQASTSEWQRLHHKVTFLEDPSYFEKLYQTNRNYAQDIAKEYGYDLEEFRTAVKSMKPMKPESGEDEEDLSDKLLAKLEEKELIKKADASVREFFEEKAVDLESDFWKEMMAEYKELAGTRKLDPEKALKYARIAYREVRQTSKHADEYERKMDELKSAGLGAKNTKAYIDEKKPAPMFNKPIKFKDIYTKK